MYYCVLFTAKFMPFITTREDVALHTAPLY